jgi:hypothetical protein
MLHVADTAAAHILTSADRAKVSAQAESPSRHRRGASDADGQPDGTFDSSRAFRTAGPLAFPEASITPKGCRSSDVYAPRICFLFGLGDLGYMPMKDRQIHRRRQHGRAKLRST